MMNANMQPLLMQLLQSLGIGGLDGLTFPAGNPQSPLAGAAQPQPQPPMTQPGFPSPGFPGQGNAFGRMGMRPPQQPTAPTAAGAATAAPSQPAPMANSNFGQQMSAWAQSKPAKPAGYTGAWGQGPQMDAWKTSKPMKPMGGM